MKPVPTKDATTRYAKPETWDDAKDGPCGVLSVRKQPFGTSGRTECVSTWQPTPEELALLNKGGVVILSVIGQQPPVALWVEEYHIVADDSTAPLPE